MDGIMSTPKEYSEEYLNYISLVECWFNTSVRPEDIKHICEFNEINIDEFDYSKPTARYYLKAHKETRKLLRSETLVPLKEVADVINGWDTSKKTDSKLVKTINPNQEVFYPYIPDLHAIDGLGCEKIHKGDIVRLKQNNFFLVDKECAFDMYSPLGCSIIRAKNVCAEYLYFYLNSQIAREIYQMFCVKTGDYSSINIGGLLEDFPVVLPKEKDSVYKERFINLSSPESFNYVVQNETREPKTIEQLINQEWTKNIRITHDKLIKKLIEDDICELNICFNNKAYKSVVILAGSILETFLIDWLSDIKGVNYFINTLNKREYNKKTKKYVTDANGQYIYKEKAKAELADYIDEIKDIKGNSWNKMAEKSHQIREKRNMIHAKIVIKNGPVLNEFTCKNIVNDLMIVIDSRWK